MITQKCRLHPETEIVRSNYSTKKPRLTILSKLIAMKKIITSLLAGCLLISLANCNKLKEETTAEGNYQGTAVEKANTSNSKTLQINLTNATNPVTGTYTLISGSSKVEGDVNGSGLGLIYTLTLKPKTSGIIYTIDATWNGAKALNGTMNGVENSRSVTYTIDLRK